MKTERSPDGIELLFARSSILHAARANGLMAFDTVYSDARNEEGFLREASLIKQLGFDGNDPFGVIDFFLRSARTGCESAQFGSG